MWFLLFFPIFCFSQSFEALGPRKRPLETQKAHVGKNSKTITRLKKENELLKRIANTRLATPYVYDNSATLRLGDLIPGSLTLSVLSTNLETPILVAINDKRFPKGSKLLCSGISKYRRVLAACTRLITPTKTYSINASLHEVDGSRGLLGDMYSGKEKYLAGIIASEMAKGALLVHQAKANRDLGQNAEIGKSAIYQGLINSGNETTELLKEELRTTEPKIFIHSKKRVLIFINEDFSWSES